MTSSDTASQIACLTRVLKAGPNFDDPEAIAFCEAELARVIEYWGRKPQKTQPGRIKAKPGRIIKKLAAQAGPDQAARVATRNRGGTPSARGDESVRLRSCLLRGLR